MAGSSPDSPAVDTQRSSWVRSSTRNVPRAPAPASGLTTNGRPHSSANCSASAGVVARRWRAQGMPASSNTVFMAALSRNRWATCAPMPGMPRRSRTSARGTCRFSRMASRRSTPPRCWPSRDTPTASCSGSRQSSSRQCPANRSRTDSGKRSCGSVLMSPTRVSGTPTTALTKRVVASRAYGATKTTLAIGGAR